MIRFSLRSSSRAASANSRLHDARVTCRKLAGLVSIIFVLCLCAESGAQVVFIENNSTTAGTSNSVPFAQTSGFTTLYIYSASTLSNAGICAGAQLTDLAVLPSTPGPGTFNAAQFRLIVGNSNTPAVVGAWTSNFNTMATIHDPASGPYSFSWAGDTWTSLPNVSSAGFTWDGVRDLGIYVSTGTGITGTFSVRRTSPAGGIRHLESTYLPTGGGTQSLGAMKLRLTFSGGVGAYETNEPLATLTIDGETGYGCKPARPTPCVWNSINATFSTSTPGLGWELVITTPEGIVPASGGGATLPSGQMINLDIQAPSLTFINGLSFPPMPSSLVIPLGSTTPIRFATQFFVLTTTNADGLALSQACDVTFVTERTWSGPFGDNESLLFNVASLSCPATTSIPFYGVSMTQFYVGSNGRILFGPQGGTASNPTLGSALTGSGFVGVFVDLDPTTAGRILVTESASSWIRVDYLGLPFNGQPSTASSFSIQMDTMSGSITLNGLNTLGLANPLKDMLVGISPGATGTLPAIPTNFSNPNGFAANATDTLVSLLPAGPLASRATLTFIPNGTGNYTWF